MPGIGSFDREHFDEYPTRLEAGTYNTPGISGLAEGIKYINEKGIENLYKKQIYFAQKFYNELKDIKYLKFYGNFKKPKTAIVEIGRAHV